MFKLTCFATTLAFVLLSSCGRTILTPETQSSPYSPDFTATKEATFSKADFLPEEQVGLYITRGSVALLPSGNLFDNKKFTFRSGQMVATTTEYYPNDATQADLYAYAPYSSSSALSSGLKLPFSIQNDQSSTYATSDLMWVAKSGVLVNGATPALLFSHKLSKISINLIAGNVTLTNPTVTLNNIRPSTQLQMATGALDAASGGATSVKMHQEPASLSFHAIIIPQEIGRQSSLISVANNEKSHQYTLPAAKIFEGGVAYTFDITVNTEGLVVTISGSTNDWQVEAPITGEAI